MRKKNAKNYKPENLISSIQKWILPMYDKRHGYYIHVQEKARSNQTRIEHIVKASHDLKTRDLDLVPQGINNYFLYKKDPVYKDTYNYYLHRKGQDRGFIKISIQIDNKDKTYAWIKTIYIAYKIK